MPETDEKQYDIDAPYVGGDPLEDDSDGEEADFGNELEPVEDDKPAEDTPEPEPEPEPDADEPAESEPEESDEEPEPETEPESKEDEPVQEKQEQRIPKQRFDEINERRKLAEKRLAELEAQQAAAQESSQGEFDFDAKEQEYMEAVVDGEFDKAKALRKEIRAAEQANVEAIARKTAESAKEATKASLEFDAAVNELSQEYDTFNPETDSYDQTLVDEVLEMHTGFVNAGHNPATALRKAVRYVAAANSLQANSARSAEPAETKAQEPAVQEKTVTKQDVQKKVKARGQQPPDMPSKTSQEPTFDLNSIPEEEFEALPESKIRELRGDFV